MVPPRTAAVTAGTIIMATSRQRSRRLVLRRTRTHGALVPACARPGVLDRTLSHRVFHRTVVSAAWSRGTRVEDLPAKLRGRSNSARRIVRSSHRDNSHTHRPLILLSHSQPRQRRPSTSRRRETAFDFRRIQPKLRLGAIQGNPRIRRRGLGGAHRRVCTPGAASWAEKVRSCDGSHARSPLLEPTRLTKRPVAELREPSVVVLSQRNRRRGGCQIGDGRSCVGPESWPRVSERRGPASPWSPSGLRMSRACTTIPPKEAGALLRGPVCSMSRSRHRPVHAATGAGSRPARSSASAARSGACARSASTGSRSADPANARFNSSQASYLAPRKM